MLGLTFLPTRIATWRYERGNRSLAANLSAGDVGAVTVEVINSENVIASEDIEVPDEIEEVIDQLIQGLGSADSVVR